MSRFNLNPPNITPPRFTQKIPGFGDKDTDPYQKWPDGEVYNDLRTILQIVLGRFNIPQKWIIRLVATGLRITTEEKVHKALTDLANHDLVDKYRTKK